MSKGAGRRWARPAAALLVLALLAGCKTELLTNVSQRQANEAIALLLRHHIDAGKEDIGKGRFRIAVDTADFSDAVSLLDKYQLPSRDDVSIADLFPADSFVNSPSTERARLISGLEQRLEQTVRAIDHVLLARVHISYGLTDHVGDSQPMHVSMMLNYYGSLSDAVLIQRLKQLVKNSFESLSYDNISVVIFHTAPEVVENLASPDTTSWSGSALRPVVGGGALLALLAVTVWFFLHRRRGPPAPVDARAQ